MVRTRATATAAPTAPLSAAPRRRLKVTPLEKEETKKPSKPVEDEPKPMTRATRGKKALDEPVEEPKPKATKPAATKPRGRPKKAETITEESEPQPEKPAEKLADKPKRATRSTRATATTASSAAKEKVAARPTRTTKAAAKERPAQEAEPEEQATAKESAPVAKAAPQKKVTFQDTAKDDKENQPITTRGGKKVAASKLTKATEKASGLRAKPVRKPTAATRSSKRTKDQVSDDEDEKPKKKIQRVLTPKKITQVAKAATPEEASEDELNGGKTPIRDLSLSPRRLQTNLTAEAIARTLSPAKQLDFTQTLLQQSARKNAEDGNGALTSPARRPPTSPAKLFPQSMLQSPAKGLNNENSNGMASPARRPLDSPAKLLFPNATKHDRQVNLSHTASKLFQSPKRSAAFDPARMFAHSAVKPQKNDLSKSTFLSSPAKRVGVFSPLKKSTTPQSTMKSAQQSTQSPDELNVNDMEVTELMNDMPEELTVSSHQRASVSPTRTYKLSADELQMDFDDSVLQVRSPLKVTRSPAKPTTPAEPVPVLGYDADATELDHEMEETMPSVQSTPRTASHHDSTFVNLQALEAEEGATVESLQEELTMTEEGDDTLILPENAEAVAATPRSVVVSYQIHDESIDELAPSPKEDVVRQFLRTPGTPATVYEHELTNMVPSPEVDAPTPAACVAQVKVAEAQSPVSLHENELTMMSGAPKAAITHEQAALEQESPASLDENELTVMANAFTPRPAKAKTPKTAATPASIAEHELTIMGGTPKSAITPRAASVTEQDSPVSIAENELTVMADGFTPRPTTVRTSIDEEDSPVSLAENELTVMADSFTARPANRQSLVDSIVEAQTPASVAEHELTTIADSFTSRPAKAQAPLSEAAEAQTPASVAEHELTVMADSFTPKPTYAHTPASSTAQPSHQARTPASVSEHELTIMGQTSPSKDETEDNEQTPVPATTQPATSTPNMPIPRKFHMHTVVSKVPLKPEAEDSPAPKLQIKKRKRPHSLGAQPDFVDISDRVTPAKAARTSSPDVTSTRATPASSAIRTPGSKLSSEKSTRRVVSTPVSRTPLTDVSNNNGDSSILRGTTIYVDVRTSEGADASTIYIELLTNLGARIVRDWKENSNLTHIVYKDGSPKILEKARLSDSDVKVVGVSWPLDCDAQKSWVDESGYIIDLSPGENVVRSVSRSAKRKSMEPSMLVTDGSGSVKRSRSRSMRRSSIKPLAETDGDNDEAAALATPTVDPAKKAADLEKNSLTAAWKSINATGNLGEDTPARRTLELLQKSYEVENLSGWDDSITSSHSDDQENTNTPRGRVNIDEDESEIMETGLTPAPYRLQPTIGSAPAKTSNNGIMSYRERVEEMERREVRDNALGTNKGERGVKGGKGKRMTMFGGGSGFEPVKGSPLGL